MYILDPTLDEDTSKALVGRIEDLMTKQGVAIEKTEPWGKRRLAYRIKGHWEGNYVLSYLKAAPEVISEMERRLRVTDGVLRYLTVRIDEEQAKLERRKAREEVKERARRERRGVRATEPRRESADSMDDYDSMSDEDDMDQEN
jgi:small subunit ribosomal protein S6